MAGAYDDRMAMVAPVASSGGGTPAYRYSGSVPDRGGKEGLTEMVRKYPNWFSDHLHQPHSNVLARNVPAPPSNCAAKELVVPRSGQHTNDPWEPMSKMPITSVAQGKPRQNAILTHIPSLYVPPRPEHLRRTPTSRPPAVRVLPLPTQ